MKKSWIVFALLLLSGAALPAVGQKFLQLEKLNSLHARKYYPGDEITFRLDKSSKTSPMMRRHKAVRLCCCSQTGT